MMDLEGGRAVRRSRRVGRLAAVVAVQNLLVVACLLVTVFLYLESPALPEENVYISFDTLTGPRGNTSLEFLYARAHKLQYDKGKIGITCTGPYVWHMHTCYENMGQGNVSGTLSLLVDKAPLSSVKMDATQQSVCRGLHSIVYLRVGEVASFHLYSLKGFRMLNVSMGLSSLLGKNCEY